MTQSTIPSSPTILQPGTTAPTFTLATGPDKKISLEDFKGKPVVLMFYPFDWSPVCTAQACSYTDHASIFKDLDASILGISVDSVWSHQAFAKTNEIEFTLLSDFEPKGSVAKAYGVFREKDGMSERALFVIDAHGVIRWSHLSPIGQDPGYEGIASALKALDTK